MPETGAEREGRPRQRPALTTLRGGGRAAPSPARLAPASAQDRIDDAGMLEDAGGLRPDAMAAGAAERAPARHPQAQPLRLDAALVDPIAPGARRQRQRQMVELGLEGDFVRYGRRNAAHSKSIRGFALPRMPRTDMPVDIKYNF